MISLYFLAFLVSMLMIPKTRSAIRESKNQVKDCFQDLLQRCRQRIEQWILSQIHLVSREKLEDCHLSRLIYACLLRAIKWLPVDLDSTLLYSTPLRSAAGLGNDRVVKMLIKGGSDVHKMSVDQWYPLHAAVMSGSLECTMALLEAKADPNVKGPSGFTCLHICSAKTPEKYDHILTLLLEKGADPSAANDFGETPLHIASYQNNERSVLILLEWGADMNKSNRSGNTPLHVSAKRGCLDTARILLTYGADKMRRNRKGATVEESTTKSEILKELSMWPKVRSLKTLALYKINSTDRETKVKMAQMLPVELRKMILLPNSNPSS